MAAMLASGPMASISIRPPRPRSSADAADRRRSDWLELFFDLVFAVIIGEMDIDLTRQATIESLVLFASLFVPIWSVWFAMSIFSCRFVADDAIHRFLIAGQMLAIGALAVEVHDSLDVAPGQFLAAYAGVRGFLVLHYLRVRRHVPDSRPLVDRQVAGNVVSIALWLSSIALAGPARHAVWAVAAVVDLVTPWLVGHRPEAVRFDLVHLSNRCRRFTLIVLGQSIVGAIAGLGSADWSELGVECALLGFATAFALWWVYFDNVETSYGEGHPARAERWGTLHLPIVAALALVGAGIREAVLHSAERAMPSIDRWLLAGAVAGFLLSLSLLHALTERTSRRGPLLAGRVAAGAGVVLAMIAFDPSRPGSVLRVVALAAGAVLLVDAAFDVRARFPTA